MNKYVTLAAKIMLVVSFVFVATKIGLYKQALRKQQLEPSAGAESINNTQPPSEVLERLNDLTAIPVVGSYYVPALVEELIRLKRFTEGL
jgi:hypothetical protein